MGNDRDKDISRDGEKTPGAENSGGNAADDKSAATALSPYAPTLWLDVLPSKQGTVLAAILANIMTEGLTPDQENILGNFISALGALISFKAARNNKDETD